MDTEEDMINQLALAAEERAVSRKQLKRLPDRLVPANMFGHEQPSLSLQVNRLELQELLSHGAKNIVVLLRVGTRPTAQALIRHVQYDPISGKIAHVDFYLVGTAERPSRRENHHQQELAPTA